MDIRYTCLLIPIVYVLLPFIFNGSITALAVMTGTTFIFGVIVFIIITNLNIGGGGSISAIATGGSGNLKLGLNSEAGYSLFVVCIGGLFYLGAQLTEVFTPIISGIFTVLNAILYIPVTIANLFGANINLSFMKASAMDTLGFGSNISGLNKWYNTSYSIQGISIFGAIDVFMGLMFMLGLYFMISSRGH
jgi:hypothetical protein